MTWNASYRLQLLFNPLTPESDNSAEDDHRAMDARAEKHVCFAKEDTTPQSVTEETQTAR